MAAEQEIFIEIPEDFELLPGQIIVQDYPWISENQTLRATQYALLERKIKTSYPNFKILEIQNLPDFVRFRIEIIEPEPRLQKATIITPGLITVAILGLITVFSIWVLGPAMTYLTARETEQLIAEPAGKILAMGIGAAGIAILLGILYLLFFHK